MEGGVVDGVLLLLSRLECNSAISAHRNICLCSKTGFLHVGQACLKLPTSGGQPASPSQSAGITGYRSPTPHTPLSLPYFSPTDPEMGFHHVGQAGLGLLTSGDPPASASRSVGITGQVGDGFCEALSGRCESWSCKHAFDSPLVFVFAIEEINRNSRNSSLNMPLRQYVCKAYRIDLRNWEGPLFWLSEGTKNLSSYTCERHSKSMAAMERTISAFVLQLETLLEPYRFPQISYAHLILCRVMEDSFRLCISRDRVSPCQPGLCPSPDLVIAPLRDYKHEPPRLAWDPNFFKAEQCYAWLQAFCSDNSSFYTLRRRFPK
ncbi:hypothetical protein AAY473_023379 [Plecturocebus cupreus]